VRRLLLNQAKIPGRDDVASLKQAVLDNLYYLRGPPEHAPNDWYMAVAYSVRDRMLDRFITALKGLSHPKVKIASYLSAEFLMGPHLGNNLLNLGITDQMRAAVKELGHDLDDLLEQEEEPGLGNGGPADSQHAMDSLASLNVRR
jgi:starch phosphorylase